MREITNIFILLLWETNLKALKTLKSRKILTKDKLEFVKNISAIETTTMKKSNIDQYSLRYDFFSKTNP